LVRGGRCPDRTTREGRLLIGGKDDDVEDVDGDPVPEAQQLP
jgi:hypothetical protein